MLKLTRAELNHASGKYDHEPPPDKLAEMRAQLAQLSAAMAQISRQLGAQAAPKAAPPQGELVANIVRNAAGKMTHITINRTKV